MGIGSCCFGRLHLGALETRVSADAQPRGELFLKLGLTTSRTKVSEFRFQEARAFNDDVLSALRREIDSTDICQPVLAGNNRP